MAVIGFMRELPKEKYGRTLPSLFPEKILNGVYGFKPIPLKYHFDGMDKAMLPYLRPKIHTIRKQSERRKKGKKLHPVINARTKEQFQFCPELKIEATQKIEFIYDKSQPSIKLTVKISGKTYGKARMRAGVLVHCDPQLKILAMNDGFNAFHEMMNWFDESGAYDIIHWTKEKY